MNFKDYLKKYGEKSFDEVGLTAADNVFFSYLSYLDFRGIVNSDDNKKSIFEVGYEFFSKYSYKQLKLNIIAVSSAIEMFRMVLKCPRYKDVYLYNYVYDSDEEDKQFGALFIDYDSTHTYVSFEGTDALISGWKEDGELAYMFPVKAHGKAVSYIDKNIKFLSLRHYILGGHSKGGNLALVAGMYCKKSAFMKIDKIYSLDGPGLREKEFYSKRYGVVDKKFELVVPDYSVVGMLLKQKSKKTVVKSHKKGLLAHNAFYWLYKDEGFLCSKLSEYSLTIDHAIDIWLENYNEGERRKFVEEIFNIFKRADIDSILDIKENMLPSFKKIIEETYKLDPRTRDMTFKFFQFLIEYIKEDFIPSSNRA